MKYYSYGNIVRVLNEGAEDVKPYMVDVNIETAEVMSEFDGSSQFDAVFIRSFLNILKFSKVGFRVLDECKVEDMVLRQQASNILAGNERIALRMATLQRR